MSLEELIATAGDMDLVAMQHEARQIGDIQTLEVVLQELRKRGKIRADTIRDDT